MRSDTAYPGSWTGYIERNVMKQLIENKVEELLSGQFCLSKACLRGNQTVFTVKPDTKKPYLKILAYKNCVAVCFAEDGKQIIGVAGASATSADSLWEIGIDVREKYRGEGLGTYLVSRLTDELMKRESA